MDGLARHGRWGGKRVRRAGTSALALIMAVALVASACGRGDAIGDAAAASEVHSGMARVDTAGTSPAAAVAAINGLGADLYRQVTAKDGEHGNVILSPYSIEAALAMTRNGAVGETRSQMDKVLRAGAGDELDKALSALDQELARRAGHKGNEARNGDVALAPANTLFGQSGLPFEQIFLDTLAKYYGAGMNLVDYEKAAEAARLEINRWAAERTNGKIIDLLPEHSVDYLTRLVLVNAIYFKAPWAQAFAGVGDKPFFTANGTTVSAPAMETGKISDYREGPGWKSVDIPYIGNELSMLVIVPDDLAAFESSFDGDTIGSITAVPKESLAQLQMPKFSFRSQMQLSSELSTLGMEQAFTLAADFSGMTKATQLHIDDVYHQAFIAVDEQGTEASAATAVVAVEMAGSCCQSFTVDKPFVFAIRDVTTGAVLFLGRVTDPTAT
jgi:serpin B